MGPGDWYSFFNSESDSNVHQGWVFLLCSCKSGDGGGEWYIEITWRIYRLSYCVTWGIRNKRGDREGPKCQQCWVCSWPWHPAPVQMDDSLWLQTTYCQDRGQAKIWGVKVTRRVTQGIAAPSTYWRGKRWLNPMVQSGVGLCLPGQGKAVIYKSPRYQSAPQTVCQNASARGDPSSPVCTKVLYELVATLCSWNSDHQFQCVGRLSTATGNSVTPAGCPTVQLNSDTVYPEIASDSTGEGLSPTRLLSPLCPLPRQPQRPITSPDCHLCFWPTGYRLEVPMTTSLGFLIC